MIIELDLRNSRQCLIEVMNNLMTMKKAMKRKYVIKEQQIKLLMISNQFDQDKAKFFHRDKVSFR